MKIDYLIIGQGLAGSLLAWELLQRNKKVIIVDNGKENASLIAAGLINPVTGMRFVKSTDVEHLLPVAIHYYQQLSQVFQQPFYVKKTLLRILRNDKELLACQKRLAQPAYQAYLSTMTSAKLEGFSGSAAIKQKQTGYLLTTALLTALKDYFISVNTYVCAEMHYPEIELSPVLKWKNYSPQQIIFCEGHHATTNPWFSWLPFQPVKGEIITATATRQIPQYMVNYGHWFIPLNNHKFRTGATFDRENLDLNTTTKAKETLLASLKQAYPRITIKQIINQQAGIRPTTLDKQPFIGKHPLHPELVMFNGFGAKGSLQIPWYCQCLADNLLNNTSIPESSNIMRYPLLSKNR